MRRRTVLLMLVPLLLVALACSGSQSGSSASTSSTQPAQSGTVAVSVVDNNFRPQDVTVTVGSTVIWTNEGRADHNIVAFGATPFHVDTASFGPGATYSWTATEPGTYRYYCSIHGAPTAAMYGSVTVVGR
ncbi:MAG: cupredoxin domain-containing protein [Acidobacteria bacterium]|nr:cupredoxin domain-containing protein [Acidobacteriota bacterium]